jgi:hypothetical protein
MKRIHMAAAAAAVLGATSVQAMNYTETLTGSVAAISPISGTAPGYYSYTGGYLTLSGFTEIPAAAQGDTIDVTVTLDQPLTIPASPSYTGLLLYLSGGPGGGGLDSFNWTFYDNATPVATADTYSTTSGDVTTFAVLYPPHDGAFTFTSFTDDITIGTMTGTVDLNGAAFEYDNDTAIPEPATWSLMLVGIGGVGAFLRGRRRARAATA